MLPYLTRSLGPTEAPTLDNLEDARVWLEDVEGVDALGWVKAKNAEAMSLLGDPTSLSMYERILKVLESKEKIPYVGRVFVTPSGETHMYNFCERPTPSPQKLW